MPVGGDPARPTGEVDRGPARALRLVGARARPAARGRGRVRRRGPAARAVGALLARQRRLHAVRADRADHHRDPAARPLQARRLPGRVPQPLHQHRARDAVPRRRPAAGLLRDGAGDGRDRARPRARPGRGPRAQLHPARGDALRPRPDLPGRPAADLRLRRLPRLARRSSRRWSAGTTSRPSATEARAEGRRVGIGLACYVEGTGVGPYEGGHIRVETDGTVVVSTGPDHPGPGPPDDARADRRRRARRADRPGQA